MSGPSPRTRPTWADGGRGPWQRWDPDGGGWGPWRRWDGSDAPWGGRRPPRVPLAIALGLFQVLGTLGAAQGQPERRPLDLLAVVLLLIGPVALALLTRRSRVPLVTAVVGAATAVYLVLGYPYGPVVASLVVALVAAVVTGHRLTAWLVAAGVLAAHGAAVVRDPDRGWSWAGATAT